MSVDAVRADSGGKRDEADPAGVRQVLLPHRTAQLVWRNEQRSMEDVEQEWDKLSPSLINDYEKKKKDSKRSWKQKPTDRKYRKDRK